MYVALLRGVNVGGNNPVAMKELAALFGAQGCTDVSTYIQSGNIVFNADSTVAARLKKQAALLIDERFGCKSPVIMRTSKEMAAVIEGNAYLREGAAPELLHVYFLADKPSVSDIDSLDAKRSAPDEFRVVGREIYLKMPNGMGRTKLTNAYFDGKLKTVSTCRNWRTVLKLAEMMGV